VFAESAENAGEMSEMRIVADRASSGRQNVGMFPNDLSACVPCLKCPKCNSESVISFGGGNESCLNCYLDFKTPIVIKR